MEVNNQKIVKFEVRNFKKISEIVISVNEDVNIVAGENRQGKTSLIDAIECALGGSKALKSTDTTHPVRNGSEEAEINLELTDFIIEKRFYENKSPTLHVKSKNGASYKSPQAMLDSFLGQLVDPSEFYKMKSNEQYKLLMDIVGLEKTLKDLEEKRDIVYSERTAVNRDKLRLTKTLEGLKEPKPNLPDKELDPMEVNQKLRDANKKIAQNREEVLELENVKKDYEREKKSISDYEYEIERLTEKLNEAKRTKDNLREKGKELEDKVSRHLTPDISIFEAELEELELTNREIRHAINYSKIQNQIGNLVVESDMLTNDIEEIDETKKAVLQKAKFPVDGLSFEDGIVTYNGVPFNQCSSEEKLTISSVIAMTELPDKPKKLKLLLVRDGSPFTEKQLEKLFNMVKSKGYQCLIERPGEAIKEAILIQDGRIKNENKT